MYDILIYLLDKSYEEEVRHLFSEQKYRAYIAFEMEEVVGRCQQELFDIALIWPATYNETTDFLTVLNINFFNFIPVIAVLDKPEELEPVLSLPIVDYVFLPMPRKEFYHILNQVIQDVDIQTTILEGQNWQGILDEYNLIDLLQMIEGGQQDAHLTLKYSDKVGHVFFREGRIVHASFMGLTGMNALKKLSFWSRGNFEVLYFRSEFKEDKIGMKTQDILMHLIQHLSELQKLQKGLPDIFEPVLANPMADASELNSLQTKIYNIAATPINIFDLLLLLEEPDEQILNALQELVQNNFLDKKEEIEYLVMEEERKSSLTKIFSAVSSIFKRREDLEAEETEAEEPAMEILAPRLEVSRIQLDATDIKEVQKKLESFE